MGIHVRDDEPRRAADHLGSAVTRRSVLALPAMLLAKDNWTPLFNGKDLDGWHFFGRNEDFSGSSGFVAENGMIHTTDRKRILCYTKQTLSHCVLLLASKV